MQIEYFRRVDEFLLTTRPTRPVSGLVIKFSDCFNAPTPRDPLEVAEISRQILEPLEAWRIESDPDLKDAAAQALRRGFCEIVELAEAREMPVDKAIEALQIGIAAVARWAYARGMRPA